MLGYEKCGEIRVVVVLIVRKSVGFVNLWEYWMTISLNHYQTIIECHDSPCLPI